LLFARHGLSSSCRNLMVGAARRCTALLMRGQLPQQGQGQQANSSRFNLSFSRISERPRFALPAVGGAKSANADDLEQRRRIIMHVEMRPINSIRPYENNPRQNDAGVDAVAASIREYGFRQPIVVDEDGVIIVGHTRYKAALKLGFEEVPVHVAVGLTPA